MILDQLSIPIVQAPLAGGPSTPALAAAVSEAGGFGFVAAGYRAPDALAQEITASRELTKRPFGVNVFAPVPGPADPEVVEQYATALQSEARRAGVELGRPRFDGDRFEDKLRLLREDPVAVVSFTFGCPSHGVIASLKEVGSEVWITVTDVEEAEQAEAAGASALVVQGNEAGGHRGSFVDRPAPTDLVNLCAGQAHELTREIPAAELVYRMYQDALLALEHAGTRLSKPTSPSCPPFDQKEEHDARD